MVYKTPGVYVREVSLFPPSVAQAQTAIPAFVGYTEQALDADGRSLAGIPAPISSLVEFQSLFGGGYAPESYKVVIDGASGNALVSTAPAKRFRLFDALRQFYDNGGGECYIVSVGSYDDSVSFDKLKSGFEQVAKVDEPTLLLCPDAVELRDASDEADIDSFATLQQAMLAQCARLQDRFSIFDILQGELAEDVSNTPLADFRDKIGVNNLSYGAAYYPWVVTTYSYDISFRQLGLYDKSDLANKIAAYDSLSANDTEKALVNAMTQSIGNTDATLDVKDASVKPDALLGKGSALLKEQLAEYEQGPTMSGLTSWLNLLAGVTQAFRETDSKAIGTGFGKDVEAIKADTELAAALEQLVAIEKNPKTIANTTVARDAAAVDAFYQPLEFVSAAEPGWLGGKKYADIAADATDFPKSDKGRLDIIAALTEPVATILKAWQRLLEAALHYEKLAELALFSTHGFFDGVQEQLTATMRTMPPSGAVAGIYATVDRTRGVWKAPANISLNAVVGPAVKTDNKEQESMNVHATGKSINAIRAFTGKGTLVWGSRTLAGNDNEWRYVPVRRFFIMVEQSVKKATEPFVFEPNDANTWVKARTMIENFLMLQWRAGALQGAKPGEAFYVRVGLNETMTAQDILEGRMIVEIGMAAVRPAEFIVLRFSHKMQSSG